MCASNGCTVSFLFFFLPLLFLFSIVFLFFLSPFSFSLVYFSPSTVPSPPSSLGPQPSLFCRSLPLPLFLLFSRLFSFFLSCFYSHLGSSLTAALSPLLASFNTHSCTPIYFPLIWLCLVVSLLFRVALNVASLYNCRYLVDVTELSLEELVSHLIVLHTKMEAG